MNIDSEDLLLDKCKKLIAEQLGWGSSDIWTNQDFEVLRERIEEKTKVNLSVATLKRIWGKVKYNSRPTTTTLDTLAQFIEFENWRVFKLKNSDTPNISLHLNSNSNGGITDIKSEGRPNRIKQNRSRFIPLLVVVPVLVVVVLYFLNKNGMSTTPGQIAESSFVFSSKKIVSEGVPNSVFFEYDASTASDEDTIYIQQSWDTQLRARVSKNENSHTSIYYYPGFFLAKLVVNDRVVKEHSLYIRTNGWLPLIERSGVPVYFKEEEVFKSGVMTLPLEKITENGIQLQPETPWVAFHNSRTFDNLMSDNFIFETEVKNNYKQGSGICQYSQIQIRIEGGMLDVPLSIKGCVSKLSLRDVDGIKKDPSPLGCDFSDWINVRYEVRNRKGEIFINNEKAFDMNLELTPVKIVGLLYRFQGTGSVNFAKFSTRDGKVIYEDTFD